ncbi:MAG: hypothetical protein FJ221_00800 [Lentisphaerae bacterium]|nr:hypothetical protein [Lentisphaerota bacterium]
MRLIAPGAAWWVAVGLAAPAVPTDAQLFISEVSSANKDAIKDRYGDASDWIEIYNPSTQTVNLAGWRLTNNSGNPSKWVFPSTNMAPKDYILVFASDRNRAIPGEELHTNFKLGKDGEYLALLNATGGIAHAYSPTLPPMVSDVSYGLRPGSTTNLLASTNTAYRYVVPTNGIYDGAWLWWGFNDSTWSNGIGVAGFDTNGLYTPAIVTSVSNLMHNKQSSLYIRVPFVVEQPTAIRSLSLRLNIDDGFVAWLNGSEIARINAATGVPAWNWAATASRTASGTLTIPISRASKRLVQGTNWFCLQAMNRSASNANFFARFFLDASTDLPSTNMTAYSYFAPPSPGEANQTVRMINGPMIEWATDTAIGIQTGSTLAVTAKVSKTFHSVVTSQVQVVSRIMYGGSNTYSLVDDGTGADPIAGDGIYHGTIPATALRTNEMIRWYFLARDVSNNVTRLPPFYDAEDSPEYFGAVAVNPALVSNLPVFWWYSANPSGAENELGTRCSVYFLSNFYDNVYIDLHGQSSQGFPVKSHNFDFNSDMYFRYEAGKRRVQDIDILSTWADKSKCRNTMTYGSFAAFGHPPHFAFPVRVHRNGAFHAIYDMCEDADDRYLLRNGLSEDGALYKMYNSLTSWWPGTPGAGTGAEKKNRRDEGNDDLKALVEGLSLTGANQAIFIYDNVDLCRAVNYFAVMAIMQDHDHGHKNYYLYRDTTGNREWSILPQDADLTFGHVWNGTDGYFDQNIVTTNAFPFGYNGNRLFAFCMTNAPNRQMFMRRVRTLLDRTLAPGQTFYHDWIGALTNRMTADYADYYARWSSTKWGPVQTNWETMVEESNRILDIYIPGRYAYIMSRPDLPPSQPAYVPLEIRRIDPSPSGGDQNQEYIEIVNTNGFAVDISDWSLRNAVSFSFKGGTVIPAGSNLFVTADSLAFRQRSSGPGSNQQAFVTGPYDGHLSSWGETVELWNASGALMGSTNYPSNPSAWQRDLRITEILHAPSDPPKTATWPQAYDYEWIELANLGTNALDLNGVSLTAGVSYRFTNSVVLPPGGRAAVVRNRAAFATRYDTNGIVVAGDFTDLLDDDGETIKLEDPNNETIVEFSYNGAWVPRADEEGWSLIQTNFAAPHDAWGGKANWAANPIWQGTPGRGDPEWPPETVAVNEWLPHSDTGLDWIELRNTSASPVDVSGWWLSDELGVPRKYVIPAGTVLAGGGFRVFTETNFNFAGDPGCVVPFALSELGDEIHLSAVTGGVALTYRHSLGFEASDRDIPFGRHVRSDSRVVYPAMASPTPGAANGTPHNGPAVISEILYKPPTGGVDFVEIYATTSGIVRLYDPAATTNLWKLSGGISYTFPSGSALTGGQYAVVAGGDPAAFRASNGIPAHIQVFGPFEGALDAAGERIRLRKPGSPEPDGTVPYVLVEEVEYDDDAPWPVAGAMDGRSIERASTAWFSNDPAHWRAGLPGGGPGLVLSDGDSDGDSLPDEWEIDWFGTIGPPGPAGDRDGNGRPDTAQFIDGSGASNGMQAVEVSLSNAIPPVVWFGTRVAQGPGYQGRVRMYAFEWTDSPTTGTWTAVNGFGRVEGGGQTVIHTNGPSDPFRAYRVRAWIENRP